MSAEDDTPSTEGTGDGETPPVSAAEMAIATCSVCGAACPAVTLKDIREFEDSHTATCGEAAFVQFDVPFDQLPAE